MQTGAFGYKRVAPMVSGGDRAERRSRQQPPGALYNSSASSDDSSVDSDSDWQPEMTSKQKHRKREGSFLALATE